MKDNRKSTIIGKKLPLLTGGVAALLWGLMYFLTAKLHGMQAMFDPMFPFLIARIIGVHVESLSVYSGILFAMLDAGVIGWLLGWMVRKLLLRI